MAKHETSLQELILDAGYEPLPYGGSDQPRDLAVKPGPNEAAFVSDLLVSAQGFNLSLTEVINLLDAPLRNREIKKDPETRETIYVFRTIRFEIWTNAQKAM